MPWQTYAAGNARRSTIGRTGQVTKVLVREDGGLGEPSGPFLLVPPGEGAVEAALVAQDLLERPHVVPVPQQELVRLLRGALAVDVGRVRLVQAHKVLVPVLRRRELPGRGLVHQALDGVHESLFVRGRVVVPFEPHVRVGTVACVGRGLAGRSNLLLSERDGTVLLGRDRQGREVISNQVDLGDGIRNGDRVDLAELGQWETLGLLDGPDRGARHGRGEHGSGDLHCGG